MGQDSRFAAIARGIAEAEAASSLKKKLLWTLGRLAADGGDDQLTDQDEEALSDRWACIKPVLSDLLNGQRSSGVARARRNVALHNRNSNLKISSMCGKAVKDLQTGRCSIRLAFSAWVSLMKVADGEHSVPAESKPADSDDDSSD